MEISIFTSTISNFSKINSNFNRSHHSPFTIKPSESKKLKNQKKIFENSINSNKDQKSKTKLKSESKGRIPSNSNYNINIFVNKLRKIQISDAATVLKGIYFNPSRSPNRLNNTKCENKVPNSNRKDQNKNLDKPSNINRLNEILKTFGANDIVKCNQNLNNSKSYIQKNLGLKDFSLLNNAEEYIKAKNKTNHSQQKFSTRTPKLKNMKRNKIFELAYKTYIHTPDYSLLRSNPLSDSNKGSKQMLLLQKSKKYSTKGIRKVRLLKKAPEVKEDKINIGKINYVMEKINSKIPLFNNNANISKKNTGNRRINIVNPKNTINESESSYSSDGVQTVIENDCENDYSSMFESLKDNYY